MRVATLRSSRADRRFGQASFRTRDERGGRPVDLVPRWARRSLSQLLPMLQSMGVVVLDRSPSLTDGLPVWIYQFKEVSPHPTVPLAPTVAERARPPADSPGGDRDQRRVEIDRFNELVMRAERQRQVVLRAAKYLRQAGFPYGQSYIESVLNEGTCCSGRSVRALSFRCRRGRRAIAMPKRPLPLSPRTSTRW